MPPTRISLIVSICIVLVLSSPSLSAAPVMQLEPGARHIKLFTYLEYFVGDEAGAAWRSLPSVHDEPEHWHDAARRGLWPVQSEPEILRAALRTGPALEDPAGFYLRVPSSQPMIFRLVDDNGETVLTRQLGAEHSEHNSGEQNVYAVKLALQPERRYWLYLFVDTGGHISVGPVASGAWVGDWHYFLMHEKSSLSSLLGVYLGAFALLALLTACILLFQFKVEFLGAELFLIGAFFTMAIRERVFYHWLDIVDPWWWGDALVVSVAVRIIGIILFAATVLRIPRDSWGFQVMAAGVVINLLIIITKMFSQPAISLMFTGLAITIICYAVLLIYAIRSAMAGSRLNAFFGLIWGIFFFVDAYRTFFPIVPNPLFDPAPLADSLLLIIAVWVYQAVMIQALKNYREVVKHKAVNDARVDFMSRLSHEIRSPLNIVIGMTDVLRQTPMRANEKNSLEVISNAGNTLLGLINNILDFAKIESGGFIFKRQNFRLDQAAWMAASTFTQHIIERNVGGQLIVAPDVPLCVTSDELRLRQVLINLLGNAFKYTEQGYIIVRVSQSGQLPDGRTLLHFAVEDTGPGIPGEEQQHLFDAFTQVEDSNHPQQAGTGLGLAICKHIVNKNGGEIGVKSRPGEGTTMWFTWPVDVNQDAEAAMRRRWAPLAVKRFLVMVPEDHVAEILVPHLQQVGAMVQRVRNMEQALTCSDEHDFDGAVIDCIRGVNMDSPLVEQFLSRGIPTILAVIQMPPASLERFDNARAQFVPMPVSYFMEVMLDLVAENKPNQDVVAYEQNQAQPIDVLVVDENPVNQLVMSQLLESLQLRVKGVNDEQQLQCALAEHPFDALFIDCDGAGYDGFDLAQWVRGREREQGLSPTPVFAVTARAAEEVMERVSTAGMDGILHKPVTRKRLHQLLYELFDGEIYALWSSHSVQAGQGYG